MLGFLKISYECINLRKYQTLGPEICQIVCGYRGYMKPLFVVGYCAKPCRAIVCRVTAQTFWKMEVVATILTSIASLKPMRNP